MVVYPDTFRVPLEACHGPDENGLVDEGEQTLDGEAWQYGR